MGCLLKSRAVLFGKERFDAEVFGIDRQCCDGDIHDAVGDFLDQAVRGVFVHITLA